MRGDHQRRRPDRQWGNVHEGVAGRREARALLDGGRGRGAARGDADAHRARPLRPGLGPALAEARRRRHWDEGGRCPQPSRDSALAGAAEGWWQRRQRGECRRRCAAAEGRRVHGGDRTALQRREPPPLPPPCIFQSPTSVKFVADRAGFWSNRTRAMSAPQAASTAFPHLWT